MTTVLSKMIYFDNEKLVREKGIFFTPLHFAKKGLDYIEKTVGKEWWKTGEYRLWDMAAGTGNLQYHLPVDALKYCYLSTIYKEDVEHCVRLFPDANCFQYDYLNDDIENVFSDGKIDYKFQWKLPEKLRNDLSNPNLKWIIYINPPYATASIGGAMGSNKQGVSDTKIRKIMHNHSFGEVSRELFAQFLYRIKREFENKKAHLGLFSTLKYLNANNDQKFRDSIFQFKFEMGFMFSSTNFSGTSKASPFPVGFLIWNINFFKKIESQKIQLDVFDENIVKIGAKIIFTIHKTNFLSKWVKRPPAIHKFPPLGSAITAKPDNKDKRDRISENFLFSFMAGRNDFQNQNIVYFLSGPAVSAGAYSVTPENFDKSMLIHAVQRIPKANWINDRDQFRQPSKKVSDEFITDCTIWNLFSNSNQTAALRNVIYENETYQIRNQFFPFLLSEIKKWKCTDSEITISMAKDEDRFLAKWILDRPLSKDSEMLLNKGKELYQFYFANLNHLRTPKYKIESWDAGWWQIRNALNDVDLAIDLLEDLKKLHNNLKEKLLPQIYDYGFIQNDIL